MVDDSVLRDFERQIEEEYRLDREALNRLMSRYGPGATHSRSEGKIRLASRRTGERQASLPYEQEVVAYLKGHADTDFNAQELSDSLIASGIQINTKRPDVSVNRAVTDLIEKGILIETAGHAGRSARRFKWRELQSDLSAA